MTTRRPENVGLEQVVAYRLHAQLLNDASPADSLAEAAGACGVQNSPPGSAALALHARVAEVTPAAVDAAIAAEKTLLQTWCMRGAPFVVPTADAAVFTAGLLPESERSLRHFIPGVRDAVDQLEMSVSEAVRLTGAELSTVLGGRALDINELGSELAGRIAGRLSRTQREVWQSEGPYASGQPLGEAVVHFVIRILTLQGTLCFAPRRGNKAPFVLTAEWLEEPLPSRPRDQARAELLRRYLHCYAPSSAADFAGWAGVLPADARESWAAIDGELRPVLFGEREAWVLADDLDALRSPPPPAGVRLLPPRDPYVQQRDRSTIVPDRSLHSRIWRTVGDPGTVLLDGRLVALWRGRKHGKRYAVEVEPLAPLTDQQRERVTARADHLAPFRGADRTEVTFTG